MKSYESSVSIGFSVATDFQVVVLSLIRCRLQVVEGFNLIVTMSTLSCCEFIVINFVVEGSVTVTEKKDVMTCEDDSFFFDFILGFFIAMHV